MFLLAFLFNSNFVSSKVIYIRAGGRVTRVAVGRDIHQPSKVFEFVKLILRP